MRAFDASPDPIALNMRAGFFRWGVRRTDGIGPFGNHLVAIVSPNTIANALLQGGNAVQSEKCLRVGFIDGAPAS